MSEAALDVVYEAPLPVLAGDRYAAAAAGVLTALEGAGEGSGDAGTEDVLEDLIARWQLTYSAHTARAYQAHLDEWLGYCGRRGADPLTVGADVVRDYQAQLEASDLAPATVRIKLAAVRSFYRFV